MYLALILLIAISLFMSVGMCVAGTRESHSTEGLIWLLIAAVCFVGLAIVDTLKDRR
jgi:hypothetical protein